jgi:hypothetical protein
MITSDFKSLETLKQTPSKEILLNMILLMTDAKGQQYKTGIITKHSCPFCLLHSLIMKCPYVTRQCVGLSSIQCEGDRKNSVLHKQCQDQECYS